MKIWVLVSLRQPTPQVQITYIQCSYKFCDFSLFPSFLGMVASLDCFVDMLKPLTSAALWGLLFFLLISKSHHCPPKNDCQKLTSLTYNEKLDMRCYTNSNKLHYAQIISLILKQIGTTIMFCTFTTFSHLHLLFLNSALK